MKKDDIDSWLFNNLIKVIIDSLIGLLRLLRPNDTNNKPDKPKPYIPLPDKPLFPWLRKKIDNILNKDK